MRTTFGPPTRDETPLAAIGVDRGGRADRPADHLRGDLRPPAALVDDRAAVWDRVGRPLRSLGLVLLGRVRRVSRPGLDRGDPGGAVGASVVANSWSASVHRCGAQCT